MQKADYSIIYSKNNLTLDIDDSLSKYEQIFI